MSNRGNSSSPELPTWAEDGPSLPPTPTTTAVPFVSPPRPPTPSVPIGAPFEASMLGIYDRVSHTCFRVVMTDPLFLHLLSGAVLPAAESDGAMPLELQEFAEFVDAYERQRVAQASATRRSGAVGSGSSVNAGASGSGTHSGRTVASDGMANLSTTTTTATIGGNGLSGSGSTGVKLEETLLRTLADNSDFFFRLASVAYQLDPHLHSGTHSCASAAAVATTSAAVVYGAGRGGGAHGVVGASNAQARGTVSAMLASTLAAASGGAPLLAGNETVVHRNYTADAGYSAAFHLCGRVFAGIYQTHCQALAERIAAKFSALRVEDCVGFRKAVWSGFSLKALEPYRSGARSESNLELRWVSEKIKGDKHLFPEGGVVPQRQQSTSTVSRIMDATLSYVAYQRRRAQPTRGSASSSTAGSPNADSRKGCVSTSDGVLPSTTEVGAGTSGAAVQENELNTFGLTKLLHNPSWQKDDESSDWCPNCGRGFVSVARPFGTRAHHCRSCGIRLCVLCITKRAHYSFAKLAKPGNGEETEERLVCDRCHREYEAVSQLHYLGALFAFAGLGFHDLVLCRTVNEQWREAAELCISEYRVLLHNCDADLHSVMTPVGVLLRNSLFLLLGEGPTSSISVVHHPEAALLLLKHIATENLWVQDSSYYFITRLSSSVLNRPDTVVTNLPRSSKSATAGAAAHRRNFQLPVVPTFSHWHLFCTAFCSRINSSYFFVKCAEMLCSAPSTVYDAYVCKALERMTRLYLSTTPLWHRLATANRATATEFEERAKSLTTTATSPFPLPLLADVTEGQLVTIWLLDLLHKDALVPAQRRCYQQLLEAVLPAVVVSSTPLVFVMLLSLQSTYAYYGYDEELFVLWRSRILAEMARHDAVAHERVVATLEFFNELDRFCAQSSAVNQTSVVGWIVKYCAKGGSTNHHSISTAPYLRSYTHRYVDLPEPILNPFKPYMVVKSIRLSGVRVAPNAATKPIWLCFSTWTNAEHLAYEKRCFDAEVAANAIGSETVMPSSSTSISTPVPQLPPQPAQKHRLPMPLELPQTERPPAAQALPTSRKSAMPPSQPTYATAQECMFLYKRENVERDQLMCISSRLLQVLLASEIGGAEMLDYSVLPLSCDSGLIEKAEGRELSNLENMDITSFVLQRGPTGCANFLASAKLFLLLNYIFSIGDRHKGNVLIGTNGALLHIDFRFIFSEKTLLEKLARSTVRIDDAFLAAVEQCQQRQTAAAAHKFRRGSSSTNSSCFAQVSSLPGSAAASPNQSTRGQSDSQGPTPPTPSEVRAAFFASAAEWFVHVRPFAAVFYELWLYAVHRHTVPYDEKELLTILNTLFDRHASPSSSASKFSTTMKESVNVCRLKDVTHSSAEVLRSFTDQVSRRISGSGVGAVRVVGDLWSNWWKPAPS